MLELSITLPIKVQNGGLFIVRGIGRHPARRLQSWEIIFVEKGCLKIQEEECVFCVEAGESQLLWPQVADPQALIALFRQFMNEQEKHQRSPALEFIVLLILQQLTVDARQNENAEAAGVSLACISPYANGSHPPPAGARGGKVAD